MIIDPDMLGILAPAFIAGAIIALAHVPLGIEVLRRGIIFLDLAVAQFAALGMIAFHVFFENHAMSPEFAAAGSLFCGLGMAVSCALLLHILEKYAGHFQEALIGSAFIFAASLSILIMANDPHGGEQMKDILAGQILWITWHDLLVYGPVFLFVSALWSILQAHRSGSFYILFALAIPFSVSLIGVYLVFTSLILPALATAKMARNKGLAGYGISLAAFALGLLGSYYLDTPSGPMIVMAMFVVSCVVFLCVRYLCISRRIDF